MSRSNHKLLFGSFLSVGALVLSLNAAAGDLMAVEDLSKGNNRVVGFEFVPSEGETLFEFEYVLPSDAKAVDVSRCAKAVPASHTAYCDYRATEQKILVIVYSPQNTPLPAGGLDLGVVRYTSASRVNGERVTGLVSANPAGAKVSSTAHFDNGAAELGNGSTDNNSIK